MKTSKNSNQAQGVEIAKEITQKFISDNIALNNVAKESKSELIAIKKEEIRRLLTLEKEGKLFRVDIKGVYASSTTWFEGSRKQYRSFLISQASRMRNESRALRPKLHPEGVHAIINEKNKHVSELVNIASFEIQRLSNEKLLKLMNAHGVMKYTLSKV